MDQSGGTAQRVAGEVDRAGFDAALHQFIAETIAADPHGGIAVSGSYVRGMLGPFSDLDLYLLVSPEDPAPRWESRMLGGVEMEITRGTAEEYRSRIERADTGSIREVIFPLATATILRDPQRAFCELTQLAAKRIDQLRTAPAPADVNSVARALCFGYRKVGNARAMGDWPSFQLEYARLMALIPRLLCGLIGQTIAPSPLELIAQIVPELHERLLRCLAAGTDEVRWSSLNDLLQRVFDRFGLGPLPKPVSRDGM